MDATQQIEDSFFGEEDDSDDEHELGEGKKQREPLALLKVFKNNHIPETEVPLYQGENVLGRDPASCSVALQARSVSGRHAVISISVLGPNDRHAHGEATEALLWDLGSLNGTRKGRLKLTPHVRYALTEGDSVVLADLPCQYVSLKNTERNTHTSTADGGREKAKGPTSTSSSSEGGTGKGVENGGKKSALPPVPVWTDEAKSLQSLQTTPKKPERTLVPESDSDSDGEKHGRKERRRIVASDSASSDLSSPTCSTFLTPANKVIPESEDESSITPSSALKGRFLKTGNDTEVSSDSSKPDPLHFNIDSDTDVEDEEVEMTKATSGVEAAVTAAVDDVSPADLHMDSDTDVEEEEMEKAKRDPEASAVPVKQDSVNPAAVTMDSDTDVEENEPVKTDTTALSGPEAALEKKKEPARSAQLNLESDTDVEDEDVAHIQDSRPPTSHVAEFNMNSDTDVEEDEETTKAIEPPSGSETGSKDLGKQAKSVDSNKVPDAKMLHHQSDSDTDVEDDITEIRTPTVAKATGNSQTRSEIQTADERSTDTWPPAETVRDEFRLDSDTDVEEVEEKMEEKEQKCAEAAVQIFHSSTPRGAGLSEEEMETEAFLSPSQLFKRPVLPSLLHPSVSPGGISHTDDDFAVAETQSFVCDAAQADATLDETPQSLDSPEPRCSDGASSFQLGLSDGSHQLPEAEEHDQEPAEEDWQLQATQLYAMKNSEGNTKAGQTQLDLDATQAYTDLMGQEEEEDGRKEEEEEETQPLAALGHSSIHTAETQLIKHRAQNEDNSDHDANEEVVASEPERKAKEDVNDEMQVDSHLSTADTLLLVRSPRQEEHTQPYAFLAAQIQKEQEETEKEEHKSSDEEVQETDEGERAQNEMKESVEQGNDDEEEGRQTKEMKNEVTRDGPEEEKKERDENKRVENDNEVDEARTQPAEADTIVETLPMCEEEEGQEEEQLNEPSSSRGTQPAKAESTQPLEPDIHTRDAIAETLPMCEEEEGQEEEENKPKNSRRPSRRRQTAKAEPKLPVESDKVTHVTIAETQPMCEEDKEEQEEEQQSEAMSTRRSSMRRHNAKAKPAKPVKSHVAIPETLLMCEEEEGQEEKPQSEAKSGRKSRRGRQTAKIESTQPLKPDSTAETMKIEEKEEEQDTRRSLRGKERRRAESGKGKGRGRAATEKEKRGKVEQEADNEEEVDGGNRGRGRKDLRQKSKDDDKASLELVEAENEEIGHLKTQEDEEESKRVQREKKEEEARDRLERERKEQEENTRLEKEREEREECEKREQEEKDRVERERIEREKKEREEKAIKEREEMKRFEREKQLEKERREQEEKDRLEQERIERENKEKEEQEKLEKEMRERQELEQKLEKERKKQEEKDRLAREKRDREEKVQLETEMREEKEKQEKELEQKEKEKESKDNKEGVEKEKRQARGKQKTGLGRKGRKSKKEEEQELEEGTKERVETEQESCKIQKQQCEEASGKKQEEEQADSDTKPRQGRRTTRKSVAPPAGVEDEGGPAKRTRSRSNSSNSVCSEQSTQDSLSEGRRTGGRRKMAEEVNERSRPSGRRTITAAASSEKEDIKQAAPSRSNSRSSDRSSSSVATQSRGRGGKGRKSVKVEEPEEEEKGEQSAAVGRGRGRGRGRGGRRPGANDIKAEASGEAEKEEDEVMAVAEDSVTSQSSSRGRKRGADVSMLTAESPQPTPKTPRRSLAGQTHKVLFTGVVDEDGEKVVVRLGGGLAKGVGDMTHLVTDKVRRTVKFLCAVARGVPIVTPDWLSKCGKAGSFLSPNAFLVKDVEQEKRFNFSLQEALRAASSQPLLQGYEIHVTPSVKPEPAHMKEIITCCGARFLPRMPSAHKVQTVVVSCEEDRALCERARSLSFPVVSAEFLLTGILQQKVDMQTHTLSLSPTATVPKPTARTRGK
ncbi:mediator of DNA damage checkpoint protein 1 [Pangasianodon hypophthalmus]|uniref:mediator of DNA damage checkpoint protein 1 n=1 Tax=Pangasianodon hypophthalmus TaxID=310915 RepID=UPI0023078C90|nr:mediator of DNA damage checkpoint protein 1 [Pangasianodon hypophthalmus]XP_034163630.2 mediator of DNA damage checkpoint protein 1 [Pangasianodon hypophthalmus]XP_034163634.2 mediator of DNA damage checkpoint protein 1 [Pangasianodon hypophthalmus]